MQGRLVCELPLSSFLAAVVEDVGEGDPGLLHERGGDGPVVVGGSESDGSVLDADLPLLVERCGQVGLDLLVEGGDELGEALDHHLLGDLLLDDHPVHLVDEQHGLDTLFERLPDDGLGLRHDTLDGAAEDEHSVQSPHGPGDVPTEVDVTGGVDKVDEVGLSLEVVDHGRGCRVDGDSPCGLLLIEVQNTLLSSEVLRHHSCSCDQVIGESGLSVIDMRGGPDVPYELGSLHNGRRVFDILFFTSHTHSPYR